METTTADCGPKNASYTGFLTPADDAALDALLVDFNISPPYDNTTNANDQKKNNLILKSFTCPWSKLGQNCTKGLDIWSKAQCAVLKDTSPNSVFGPCFNAIPDKTVGDQMYHACLALTCR
ncbi:unnamed protein product, partial [Didymodactylos carnosus]